MGVISVHIGDLPCFVGEWSSSYNDGNGYDKMNIVSFYGSSFISTVNGNKLAPCSVVLSDSGLVKSHTMNAGWEMFSDGFKTQELLCERNVDLVMFEFDE